MNEEKVWDKQYYHGWTNRYPFTEVVSFVLRNFSSGNRSETKILDLGCGGGHHLVFLATEGFDYYGVDAAQKGIEIAKDRLKEKGFSDSNVLQGTFEALPFPDGFFDGVIDRGALVCNKKEKLPSLIHEIHRVTKPKGKFFSAFLHHESTSKDTGTHLGNNDYTNFTGRLKDAGILHFLKTEEVQEIFQEFLIQDVIVQRNLSVWNSKEANEINSWAFIYCQK